MVFIQSRAQRASAQIPTTHPAFCPTLWSPCVFLRVPPPNVSISVKMWFLECGAQATSSSGKPDACGNGRLGRDPGLLSPTLCLRPQHRSRGASCRQPSCNPKSESRCCTVSAPPFPPHVPRQAHGYQLGTRPPARLVPGLQTMRVAPTSYPLRFPRGPALYCVPGVLFPSSGP